MRNPISPVRGIGFMLCLLTLSLVPVIHGHAAESQETEALLRIRIGGKIMLGEADLRRMTFGSDEAAVAAFRDNVVPLKRGEAVQLQVEVVDGSGRTTDVTQSRSVEYQSLSPWKLSVTPQGLVIMTTGGSLSPLNPGPSEVGDTAVAIGYANGGSSAWNKIFFRSDQ